MSDRPLGPWEENPSPWPRGTVMVGLRPKRGYEFFCEGYIWVLGENGYGNPNASINEYPDGWAFEEARPATPEEEAAWRLGGKS